MAKYTKYIPINHLIFRCRKCFSCKLTAHSILFAFETNWDGIFIFCILCICTIAQLKSMWRRQISHMLRRSVQLKALHLLSFQIVLFTLSKMHRKQNDAEKE